MSEGNTLVPFKINVGNTDCDYIKHSFCIMGTFVSAYSSHSYGVSPPKI